MDPRGRRFASRSGRAQSEPDGGWAAGPALDREPDGTHRREAGTGRRGLGAWGPPLAAAGGAKGAATETAASTVKVVADSQKQGAYQPDPVTVQAGQSVTWTWEDQGNQHSVSADDSSFESCLQGAGSTFTTTFVKAGTYAYHCSIHPQMKGTVTVT